MTDHDSIRELCLQDINELLYRVENASHESGWQNFLEYDPKYISQQLASMILDDEWLVVGTDDIGAILIASAKSSWYTPSIQAYEHFFYVHPEKRGRGCMKKLIDYYVKWAKGRNSVRVHIGVNLGINNEIGEYLCGSMGFRATGKNFSLMIGE